MEISYIDAQNRYETLKQHLGYQPAYANLRDAFNAGESKLEFVVNGMTFRFGLHFNSVTYTVR